MSITRKQFLTGATAAAASALTAGSAIAAPIKAEDVAWDAEYDVVVIGFGAAGASTAINSAEMGANTLLMEKAPQGYEGGNSAVCFQWIAQVFEEDKDRARAYIKAMRGGFSTPTDEMIDAWIDEVSLNQEWLVAHGAPNCVARENYAGEFPDMEGAGSISIITVDGQVMAQHSSLYRMLRNLVAETDGLETWFGCRATHLIQDAEGVVRGVECECQGQTVRVRAKNGVALTCGGYEANPRMLEDFNEAVDAGPLGACFWNEGDGINMAMEAGARLWHVHNYVGPNSGYKFERTGVYTFGFSSANGMGVGPDGNLYIQDGGTGPGAVDTNIGPSKGSSGHGKMKYYGDYVSYYAPRFTWHVFDEDSVHLGKIHKSFDEGNQWEIDHGYYTVADTLEELAGKLELPLEPFMASVERYNAVSEHPLQTPPYYAIKNSYHCGNTQGGPERDERGRVIAIDGTPIPHLYEAGELGDIWSHCYNAASNIGGGLAFGRIIARQVCQTPEDTDPASQLAGEGWHPAPREEAVYECADNQFIGKGQGKGGLPMVVRVTKDGDAIADVEILEHYETLGLVDKCLEQMPQRIIEAQSTDVDVVTGATMTSIGIISAVADALK